MNRLVELLFGILLTGLCCGISTAQFSENEKDLLKSGAGYLQKGEIVNALAEFDKTIAINPRNYTAYFLRGWAKFIQYDHQGAIGDLSQAIKLAPTAKNIEKVYNLRAGSYFLLKKYDQAFADYDKAISVNPNLVDPYVGRGNALLNKGLAEKALRDYDKAIGLDPKTTAAYIGRADVRFELNQLDLALNDLNKSLELQPDVASSYLKRGAVYGIQGKWSLAIADLSRAAELNSSSKSPYWGNVAVGVDDIHRYVQHYPKSARALAVRGHIYLFRGMDPDSKKDLENAYLMDPSLKKDVERVANEIRNVR
jgi:tetratricopeptide (TPR) repeat protein